MRTYHIGTTIGIAPETMRTVKSALDLLKERPRHGLKTPVTNFEVAPAGTKWFGKRIHFWVTSAGKKIGLRIAEFRSRPRRRVLNDLLEKTSPPTLVVYERMNPWTILHKLAECIQIGLNRVRYGLIKCIVEKVHDGLVERCDNGNFSGRIPNQFQLSAMQCQRR